MSVKSFITLAPGHSMCHRYYLNFYLVQKYRIANNSGSTEVGGKNQPQIWNPENFTKSGV